MDLKIEFEAPVGWMKSLVESHSARIRIRDIRKSNGGVKDLIDLFIPAQSDRNQVSFKLMGEGAIQLANVDDNHSLAIIGADNCPVCNAIPDWDLFLVDAHTTESGDVVMEWLVPDENTISAFLEKLKNDGIKYKLLKKQNLAKREDITARQEYVVRTALELGFFDYPKKINLKGLSRRLNVSYVTLAEILRRAEKNIIHSYFREEN